MTEAEWLTGTKGAELAEFYGERFTERKARLVMLACCQRNARFIDADVVREAVAALAEHYADPCAVGAPFDGPALRKLHTRVRAFVSGRYDGAAAGVGWGVQAAVKPVSVAKKLDESFGYLVYSCLTDTAGGLPEEGIEDEPAVQAAIVREVVGNPFKPVVQKGQRGRKRARASTFDPTWRTDTALALARQMYATDEFSAMPILADALQDAGCDNEDVLTHCRDATQMHVRGCWVVDLLL